MNRSIRRLAATLVCALALIVASIAVGRPAVADAAGCRITGFAPHAVVIGTAPQRVRFSVRSTCDAKAWIVSTVDATVSSRARTTFFGPRGLTDAMAGPSPVQVLVAAPDSTVIRRTFAHSLVLRHASRFGELGVTTSISAVRLTTTLSAAEWSTRTYVASPDRRVSIQFSADGRTFSTIRTVRTDASGLVAATLRRSSAGRWRVVAQGTASAAASSRTSRLIAARH